MGVCESNPGKGNKSNNNLNSNIKPIKENLDTQKYGSSNNNNNNKMLDNTKDYLPPNKDCNDNAINNYDKKDDSSEEKDETNYTTSKRPPLHIINPKSIYDSTSTKNSLMYSTNSSKQEEIFKKGDIMNSDYFKKGEESNIFSSTRYENGEKPLSESYISHNNNISEYNQNGYINKSMGSKSNYENRINTSIHGSYAGISQSAYLSVPKEDQEPGTDIGEISESMLQRN